MQHEFGDDEHFDDDDLVHCQDCDSTNIDFVDASGVDLVVCQECGSVQQN